MSTDPTHIPPAAETAANLIDDALKALSGNFDAEAAAPKTHRPARRKGTTGPTVTRPDRPHCFKQVCSEPVAKRLNPQPGVFISTCADHLDDADTLARTGRL